MKKLFVVALIINLNLYTMETGKKDKKNHSHRHHKHHHDKLTIYPDVDKKDIYIVLTEPENNRPQRQKPNEGFFSRSLSAVSAIFNYLNQG